MKNNRSLIGYILSPITTTSSFGIPVYQNLNKACFEFHKIDDGLKFITDFDEIPEKPLPMIELPEHLKRHNVEIGDDPFFVITMNALLFVGTADELKPHLDGIRQMSGEHFIKELELIPFK
jgi:hypothetical protein